MIAVAARPGGADAASEESDAVRTRTTATCILCLNHQPAHPSESLRLFAASFEQRQAVCIMCFLETATYHSFRAFQLRRLTTCIIIVLTASYNDGIV